MTLINISDFLDLQGALVSSTFVACNLDHLSKFGPEELNLAAVGERQLHIEATATDMVVAVDQLATCHTDAVDCGDIDVTSRPVTELQQKLETISSSVGAHIDHLTSVCNSSLTASSSQTLTHQVDDTDRN
jgi:hypothetical protein